MLAPIAVSLHINHDKLHQVLLCRIQIVHQRVGRRHITGIPFVARPEVIIRLSIDIRMALLSAF